MLHDEDVFGIDEELDTEGIESPGNSFRGLARVGPGAIADADADSDSDLDDADTIRPSESNASSGGQPMRGYGFRIPRKGYVLFLPCLRSQLTPNCKPLRYALNPTPAHCPP